jgi:nitrite reductase (NO-forming) / hydroxylamine reductase
MQFNPLRFHPEAISLGPKEGEARMKSTVGVLGVSGLAVICLMLISACGNGEDRSSSQPSPTAGPETQVLGDPGAQAAVDSSAGQRGYQVHCRACHQADGTGLRGAFPPLAGNPNIAGNPQYLAEVILKGQTGRIEVLGVTYDGVMPPMSYLSDQEVAAITNYVLNNFGHEGGSITPAEVHDMRADLGL